MDYIFGIVLQLIMVHLLLISYDIACQWFVNIFKRMEEHWPDEIKPTRPIKLIPAIPKLHEPMHGVVIKSTHSIIFLVLGSQIANALSAFGPHIMRWEIQQKLKGPALVMTSSMTTSVSGTGRNILGLGPPSYGNTRRQLLTATSRRKGIAV